MDGVLISPTAWKEEIEMWFTHKHTRLCKDKILSGDVCIYVSMFPNLMLRALTKPNSNLTPKAKS